jgi:hypothetical protein
VRQKGRAKVAAGANAALRFGFPAAGVATQQFLAFFSDNSGQDVWNSIDQGCAFIVAKRVARAVLPFGRGWSAVEAAGNRAAFPYRWRTKEQLGSRMRWRRCRTDGRA